MKACPDCTSDEVCLFMGFCIRGVYEPKDNAKEPESGINTSFGDLKSPDSDLKNENDMLDTVGLLEIGEHQLMLEVSLCFNSDTELHKYHVLEDKTHEEMIEHTCNTIKSIEHEKKYFKVGIIDRLGGFTSIGYTVLINNPIKLLYSFGIQQEYREKGILKLWLQEVAKQFNNEHYEVPLYIRNTRAIQFFLKNDFTIRKNENDYIVLRSNPQQ